VTCVLCVVDNATTAAAVILLQYVMSYLSRRGKNVRRIPFRRNRGSTSTFRTGGEQIKRISRKLSRTFPEFFFLFFIPTLRVFLYQTTKSLDGISRTGCSASQLVCPRVGFQPIYIAKSISS